jgi:hypothetical protein
MQAINFKKKYAIYRRIEEMQNECKSKSNPMRMMLIYKRVAVEFGYMHERPIIAIYGNVLKNRYKPEFKREKLLYEKQASDYATRYSTEADRQNIEKIKTAKTLARENAKSEWHYYIFKRFEELSSERKGVKKAKTGLYMDIADEFHLRNHISAFNIITTIRKIVNEV